MDKRLEQALEHSNFRLILAARQENLKVLLRNRLLLTYDNGLFRIDSNMITLVKSLIDTGEKEFVFIDSNDIPILIKDLTDFWNKIIERYKDAYMKYYNSYLKLEEAREIRKVINWDGDQKE